jgi:hypothetical protein
MKLTTSQLRKLINEEVTAAVTEAGRSGRGRLSVAAEKHLQAIEDLRDAILTDPDLGDEEDMKAIIKALRSVDNQIKLEYGMDYYLTR